MGRIYTVSFENVAVTAAQDFFEVDPADDKPVAIHGILLYQYSDLADAAEEILRVQIIRGHATSGSGGSTATPTPMNPNDTAAGDTTVEINNTTIASTGTAVVCYTHYFNTRQGLEIWYPPEARPQASEANTTIVVRLLAAPTDSLSMGGTLIYEELN
jgi:hypothetical protein